VSSCGGAPYAAKTGYRSEGRGAPLQTNDIRVSGRKRRRFDRKKVLWAATIIVRGQRFEGAILDLSFGGARLRFGTPLAEGEELRLILKDYDALDAKVVWQRGGEVGLQFLASRDGSFQLEGKIPLTLLKAMGGWAPRTPGEAKARPHDS